MSTSGQGNNARLFRINSNGDATAGGRRFAGTLRRGLAEERSLLCTASSLNYLHRRESVLRPFVVVLLPLDLGPFGVVAGAGS